MSLESIWSDLGGIVKQASGRLLVATDGGLYAVMPTTIAVPYGSVEGAIHELCHWVVADEAERRQENFALSQDWSHPRWLHMVQREEEAWALEYFLFSDRSPAEMASIMTPEARSSGGGGYLSMEEMDKLDKGRQQKDTLGLTAAALAELVTMLKEINANKMNKASLREKALKRAEDVGLPVEDIQDLIERWLKRKATKGSK